MGLSHLRSRGRYSEAGHFCFHLRGPGVASSVAFGFYSCDVIAQQKGVRFCSKSSQKTAHATVGKEDWSLFRTESLQRQ